MRDPPLTAQGRLQARQLRDVLPWSHFPVAVVSPLSRTLQTAEELDAGERVCVSHWHSERNPQLSPSDTGSPPAQLAALFPQWRFEHLPEVWWGTRESDADWKTERVRQFKMHLLHEVRHDNVVVIGHACFTKQVLHGNGHAKLLRNCQAQYALLHADLTVELLHLLN